MLLCKHHDFAKNEENELKSPELTANECLIFFCLLTDICNACLSQNPLILINNSVRFQIKITKQKMCIIGRLK